MGEEMGVRSGDAWKRRGASGMVGEEETGGFEGSGRQWHRSGGRGRWSVTHEAGERRACGGAWLGKMACGPAVMA
jgi:hypothetical protein